MDNDEYLQELKENEIKRLMESLSKEEPIKGILTDDEILKYAGNSVEASRIRLKRGSNDFQDKLKIHGDTLFFMWFLGLMFVAVPLVAAGFLMNIFIANILFFCLIFFLVGYTLYYLYFKDYSVPQYQTPKIEIKQKEKQISSNEDNLLLIFKNKEKIAR